MQQQHADADLTQQSAENLINADALKANVMSINYVRALMAIAVGIAAGIAGLTGSRGFLFYALAHFCTSFGLLAKMKFNTAEYIAPQQTLFWFALDGLTAQALSFVMFWTLSFAMIHIF